MCIIHDSHIMHGSWDMKCNRHNFLSFWATFFPFYPHSSSKNQKKKIKNKKCLEISSFHTSVPKTMTILCYTVSEIWHLTDVIFGLFFVLLKHLEISSIYTCLPKNMIRCCMVPEIWCKADKRTADRWMDEWTDGKVTYRGGCPT